MTMPIELKITPGVQNMTLHLFADLPPHVVQRPVGPDDWTEAHGRTPDGCTHHFYYCPYCPGWIEGVPTQDALPEERGTAFNCLRCGEQIGFSVRLA